VGQFETLISEMRSVDRARSAFEMTQLSVSTRYDVMESIANQRQRSSLILASAQKQSFEVLCSFRYSIFKELSEKEGTRKWSYTSGCLG